jgi:hypothetical protein
MTDDKREYCSRNRGDELFLPFIRQVPNIGGASASKPNWDHVDLDTPPPPQKPGWLFGTKS